MILCIRGPRKEGNGHGGRSREGMGCGLVEGTFYGWLRGLLFRSCNPLRVVGEWEVVLLALI